MAKTADSRNAGEPSVLCSLWSHDVNSLTEHLQQFGIRQFPNSAYYWEWAAKRLGRRLAGRVNRVRQPLIEERATAKDLLRFYDFTADPRVSGVVHSMKADAIRACGAFCARLLQGRRRILDIGCNVGFLSTWFARLDARREIVGVDVSPRSIAEATGKAATLGISNITFEHCDVTKSVPGREYDAVVDCDTVSSLGDVFAAFRVIRSVLAPGGVLVSVASLPCAHDAKQFVATLNLAGLQVGHCEWVRCSDLGRQQFFLGMVASLQEADLVRQIDFDQQYRQMGEYCNSILMASDTRPLRRTVVTPKQHSEASHERHGQVAASDTGGSHMLGVTNTKYAFGQHLSRIGFVLDQPPQIVAQALAEHMGPQRHAQYRQITAGASMGEEAQNRVYDFMQNLREANLLRCLSPNVTLDTSYYLYEKALPYLRAGNRIIELACWTGGLSSFIAENHPECMVVGVDRVRRVVELDRAHYRLPNLGFTLWDYRHPKPEDLRPADILMCALGTNCDCPPGAYDPRDPLVVRTSEGYHREKQEASRYFIHWRQVANDGAILLTVLRVFTFPRFLAFVDAAQDAGWTPLFEQFAFVACPSNKEAIPSLVFAAQPSAPIGEDTILSHWMRTCAGSHQLAKFAGPAALGMYRALGEKHVLAQRDFRNKLGFPTREEVGICGAFGYVYGQDARPDYQLTLVSITEAQSVQRSFGQPVANAFDNNVVLVM